MSGNPKRRLRKAPPQPREPFPIPPNPLLAAILISSKPEMEKKIIVKPDFSTTC